MKGFSREIAYVPVLSKIDLELKPGELACLLGPNGAGKSTLLSTLCAPQRLHSGKLLYEGKEIKDGPSRRYFLSQCLYLGHEAGLFYDLTVSENLDFFAKILVPRYFQKSRQNKERKDLLLEMSGLKDHKKKTVGILSRGMQQRLGLSRCFLRTEERQMFLLDEPLSSLDTGGRRLLRALLMEAKARGAIILVSSHQKSFFYEKEEEAGPPLVTRFLLLRQGHLIADIPIKRYRGKAKVKLDQMLFEDLSIQKEN